MYCREGLINAVTSCDFTLPSGKFLPPDFRMGVSNATPGGSCQATGSNVSWPGRPRPARSRVCSLFTGQSEIIRPSRPGERVRISAITLLDSDGDGLPDSWELQYELDERNANDTNGANGDPDDDGYSNIEEFNFGTDPLRADTDGDGINDQDEIELLGTDPLDPDSDSTRTPQRDRSRQRRSRRGRGLRRGRVYETGKKSSREPIVSATGQVPTGVGESGSPTAQPTTGGSTGGSSGGNGGGLLDDVLDNLDGTDRTGGLPLLSIALIVASLLSLGGLAYLALFRRQKIT